MYSAKTRKYLVAALLCAWVITLFYLTKVNSRPQKTEYIKTNKQDPVLRQAFDLLKARKDADASVIFAKILTGRPDNPDALWGKAEVLRRARRYPEAEAILNGLLNKDPRDARSLISLAYIRYKDDELDQAQILINRALNDKSLDRENQALSYMMLGSINSRRSSQGWFFSKIKYGLQIKGYFLKAEALAPDLPEVHLGLGTFYLLAPAITGGNPDKAVRELELAVRIAPEFATANARLAQAYQKKGITDKYNFYIRRARGLDPENELLAKPSP